MFFRCRWLRWAFETSCYRRHGLLSLCRAEILISDDGNALLVGTG